MLRIDVGFFIGIELWPLPNIDRSYASWRQFQAGSGGAGFGSSSAGLVVDKRGYMSVCM